MNMNTFASRVKTSEFNLKSNKELYEILESYIAMWCDDWHNDNITLNEYLGLTIEEYKCLKKNPQLFVQMYQI